LTYDAHVDEEVVVRLSQGTRSWAIVLGLVVLVVGLLAQPAQAAPPVSLAGETFIGTGQSEGGPIGTSEVSGTCNASGISTFTFTVTGTASGPYPGTFTESGSFTLGPAVTQPDGNIVFPPLALDATFTILSATTTITGQKSLSPRTLKPYDFGACGEGLAPFGFSTPNAAALQIMARYEAVIPRDGKTFRDHGDSFVDYGDLGVRDTPFNPWAFVETFGRGR
jgi:hypothetical protein